MMTTAQKSVTQELDTALELLDRIDGITTEPLITGQIENTRQAIERAKSLIQRTRCEATAALDKL
jgi:hypothetical protein